MIKKICNILNILIIIILIIIASILLVPKAVGMNTLAVLSGSMEPNIPVGSLVVIDKVDFEDLEVGDIITYSISDSTLVTHRIESINSDTQEIMTKGDANQANDGEPILFQSVKGKLVFNVPFLGYLSMTMKSYKGIVIICGIVFILIILNYLPTLFEKEE